MRFQLFLILFFVILVSGAYTQPGRKQVEEGNELFAEERYDEAHNKYRDALIDSPENPIVHFNIGDVLYKKRNYEEALKSFEKATYSDDIMLQSQSYYNMGNTLYRMGKLPESILMYKKALELNPEAENAKYNLEFVRRKLKDQSQNQSQENQDQQQQQQQQQGQQNQDQQGNQQDQKQDSEQQEEQQEQGEQANEQRSEEEQQQQASQAQEISKEDAERILDALENEEQDLLQQQKTAQRGRAFRGKDW